MLLREVAQCIDFPTDIDLNEGNSSSEGHKLGKYDIEFTFSAYRSK